MYNTLIVLDDTETSLAPDRADTIGFRKYLRDYPKRNERKTRIINLCDTEYYLSKGYYCSLLAEARHHQVLPSVKTINQLRNFNGDGDELVIFRRELAQLVDKPIAPSHLVYFGKTEAADVRKLAERIFNQYPAPILKLNITEEDGQFKLGLSRVSLSELDEQQRGEFQLALEEFTRNVWRIRATRKHARWDMAILVDPEEQCPPSDNEAIARFVKAASKYDINADVVSYSQIKNINNYDALFIRETTAIDHHTFQLASKAEDNGLIVMDDATSILRCCNKVYLHDAFNYQKVPSLKTEVVDDAQEETLSLLEAQFGYPLVLKMPEGSFSRGVFKVRDRDELRAKLHELFALSALVLAQEYLYTDFDWRIGVLNGRAIYASKYLMARNHWQIYNHSAGKRSFSGGFETLPTFEVPRFVLEAALKAANVVGQGLYGVDLKEVDKKAYVLEVNDNPSLDYKVEDGYLGKELYMQIMAEFHRRLEARGR